MTVVVVEDDVVVAGSAGSEVEVVVGAALVVVGALVVACSVTSTSAAGVLSSVVSVPGAHATNTRHAATAVAVRRLTWFVTVGRLISVPFVPDRATFGVRDERPERAL